MAARRGYGGSAPEVDSILAAMYAESYGDAAESGKSVAAGASSPAASAASPASTHEEAYDTVGDRAIWNETVQLPDSWEEARSRIHFQASEYERYRALALRSGGGNASCTISAGEVWRAKAMAFLRGRFDKMCGNILGGKSGADNAHTEASSNSKGSAAVLTNNSNPSLSISQAFERWVFNCDSSVETMDLPLPTPDANRTLMRELKSCGMRKHAAIDTVRQLQRFAKRACNTLKRSTIGTSKAILVSYDAAVGSRDTATSHVKESSMLEQKLIVLSFGKTRVKITQHHFEKLLRMHRMSVSPLSRNGASPSTYQTSSTKINRKRSHSTNSQQQFSFLPADMPTPTSHELDIIFAVVLRYNTLVGPQTQGAGFQAALTGECFDTLLVEFGCRMECFASPLNSRYGRFCSAFPAIDRAFGSLGSFFSFFPKRGSYEANPPFVDSVIYKMALHMCNLLENASSAGDALQFVIIIPAWKASRGWKKIKTGCDPFMTRHLVVPQRDHGYTEGAQWMKTGSRFRISTCNTSVFFLQTEAARCKWPVGDAACERLVKSFRSKHAIQHKDVSTNSVLRDSVASGDHDGSESDSVEKLDKLPNTYKRRKL